MAPAPRVSQPNSVTVDICTTSALDVLKKTPQTPSVFLPLQPLLTLLTSASRLLAPVHAKCSWLTYLLDKYTNFILANRHDTTKATNFFLEQSQKRFEILYFHPPTSIVSFTRLLIVCCCHCRSQLFFISRSPLCNNDIRSVSRKSNFKSAQMASCVKQSLPPHVQNAVFGKDKKKKREISVFARAQHTQRHNLGLWASN